MTRQQLIDIDRSNAAGQANREIWAGCVRNLCQKFLSNDQWLAGCNTIELINVTNTLKDGLELDLLRRDDATLTTAFDRIALRIRQQPFAEAGHLAELGNCANFMRCLFEHDLLGGHDEPTGQAMRHLTDEIGQMDTQLSVSRQNAQQLINLASFLKATDRWLAGTGQMRGDGSHAPLARATASLIAIISQLGKADTQWMCTPQTTALLSALQHLWQRGLVSTSYGAALSHLLTQLLQQIPHWQLNDSHRPLVLQSLRALIALTSGRPLAGDLRSTAEFGHALRTLLQQLQQSRPATISHDDQLATLQAVQVGTTLGILTLKQFQPLLQHLLKTSKTVDLNMLAQAIQAGDTAAGRVETLNSQALDLPPVMANANPAKVRKQPGATYRGQAPAPKPAPSATPQRDPLATSEDPWIEPRHVAKSAASQPLTVVPSPPTTLNAASTIPTLTTRQPARPAASRSVQATIAQKGAIAETPTASTVKALPAKARLTLQQAQREWFELLNDRASKVLPRLQTLANQYPELLSQKSGGKRGHTALFHALTKGRKDIVNSLINHPQHTLDGDLGSFLQEALDAIGLVERTHVASIRLLISAEVERHDRRFSDQQAQRFPGEPLPAKAIIKAHRTTMLGAEQKAALARFAELKPMLEEFKLILPDKPVKASEKTPRTTLTTASAQLGVHPAMNPGLELETKPVEQIWTSSAERRHDGPDPRGVVSSTNRPARASEQTTADTAPLLAYSEPGWLDKLGAKQKDQRFLDYKASLSKPRLPRTLIEFEKVLEIFASGMPAEIEYITSNGLGSSGPEAINQYAGHTGHTGLDMMTFSVCTDDLRMLERSMQNTNHLKTLTESSNAHGLNALMVAAYAGKTQMVSAMLEALDRNHDVVKIQSSTGMNAVMAAAARGNTEHWLPFYRPCLTKMLY